MFVRVCVYAIIRYDMGYFSAKVTQNLHTLFRLPVRQEMCVFFFLSLLCLTIV